MYFLYILFCNIHIKIAFFGTATRLIFGGAIFSHLYTFRLTWAIFEGNIGSPVFASWRITEITGTAGWNTILKIEDQIRARALGVREVIARYGITRKAILAVEALIPFFLPQDAVVPLPHDSIVRCSVTMSYAMQT